MITVLRNFVCFAIGFLVISISLRPAYTNGWLLTVKQRHLEETIHEYDAIFIGSSRIYRAFDPNQFADLTSKQGQQLNAYNFGVPGLRPHEMQLQLDNIVAAKPRKLKYVLIELMEWYPPILNDLKNSDRTVHWHTLGNTVSAIQTVWLQKISLSKRLDQSLVHADRWLKRFTNYGRGLQRIAQLNALPVQTTTLKRQHGFVSTDQERGPYFDRRRETFLKKYRDVSLKQIAEIDAKNRETGSLEEFPLNALLKQQRKLKRAGLTPIYVLPNVRWGTPGLHLLKSQEHLDNILIFNLRSEYPELYVEEHYFDRGHLNAKGASHFTRLLADQLSSLLNH
jgi:hypothetical protein